MTTIQNYHFSNYCSDSDDEAYGLYASEHPYDANQDSDLESFYDDLDSNLYEPTHGLVGQSRSEARQARRVAPPLVVLTSLKTTTGTGCETMKGYDNMQEIKRLEQERQEKKKLSNIKEKMEKMEKMENAKRDAFMAILPTESRLGKQKRLRKEREERQLKSKLAYLARKKKRKAGGTKPLPFKHRRNGGGKRRSKMAQHGTKEADREIEVIRIRRAAKKKKKKAQKKIDEAKRQEDFKMVPPKVVEFVTPDYIVEESDDEEREHEREQMQIIRSHVVKNFQDFDQYIKPDITTKMPKEEPWTRVGKKKKKMPMPIVIIKLVTPKLIEEEKIEEGHAKLVDTKTMRSSLARSKMCRSVGTGRPCPHGAKCRYAHTPEELKVPTCFFKDACNRVRKTKDGYKNCCKRKCLFIHPGEDMVKYCRRLRIVHTPRCKPCCQTTSTVVPSPTINQWKHKKPICDVVVQTTLKKQKRLCRSVGTGRPCPHGDKCRFRHK
jgi:hypothetical protein